MGTIALKYIDQSSFLKMFWKFGFHHIIPDKRCLVLNQHIALALIHVLHGSVVKMSKFLITGLRKLLLLDESSAYSETSIQILCLVLWRDTCSHFLRSQSVSQSKERPYIRLARLTWKMLGESESTSVRGIQIQPKLFL